MPARHISSQSFDEILSDLGDDPAIPDPHGIRKSPPSQNPPSRPSNQNSNQSFKTPLAQLQIPGYFQKLGGLLTLLIGILIASAVAYFVIYNALNSHSQSAFEESHQQISNLRKELAMMRDEIQQDQDDLYTAIEEIEVSIHSLKEKRPETRILSKPQTPSHEAELRRWRYLGVAQMGSTHQAFFNTGKGNVAFEVGAQVLGEWRLNKLENGLAIFTHPQGRSLTLKTSSGE